MKACYVVVFNRSFKRFKVAFLEQLKVTTQGISIPPQSCLQRCRRPVTSTEIDPPRARKYHAIFENSRGKWPTVSPLVTTLTANLSKQLLNSLSQASLSPIDGFQISLYT